MAKRLTVFITSLTVLIFITGCPQAAPQRVETPKAKPAKVEPPKAEPAKVEPPKPKPLPTVSFHDKCADILENYVDDKGMVTQAKKTRAEKAAG
jgi:hypothetical protein